MLCQDRPCSSFTGANKTPQISPTNLHLLTILKTNHRHSVETSRSSLSDPMTPTPSTHLTCPSATPRSPLPTSIANRSSLTRTCPSTTRSSAILPLSLRPIPHLLVSCDHALRRHKNSPLNAVIHATAPLKPVRLRASMPRGTTLRVQDRRRDPARDHLSTSSSGPRALRALEASAVASVPSLPRKACNSACNGRARRPSFPQPEAGAAAQLRRRL